MSINASSSSNVSFPTLPLLPSHSNSSHNVYRGSCFSSAPGSSIFAVFTVANVLLLLPLSVFILCCGFRQWRKWRGEAMNSTDVFTYHMVAMEMIGICGSVVCCGGAFLDRPQMIRVGCNMFAINSCIKMNFHVLTCVERYVAVVHPITYLHMSKAGGVTIRNIGIGCVWLLCSGLIAIRILTEKNFTLVLFFSNLTSSLIIISFCSLSVLRVLVGPAPGDEDRNKKKADNLKRRAFVTITAIMAVLLLRFGGNLVCMALASSRILSESVGCVVRMLGIWFCLPSSYILPLLFLHRAEKLPCLHFCASLHKG